MELTKEDYYNLCYRIKGETVEWSSLIQYQLCFIICFSEMPNENTNSVKFGNRMFELYEHNFNNQINKACKVLKQHPLFVLPPDVDIKGILHDIRGYRNYVTHRILEISRYYFVWNKDASEIYGSLSIEEYTPENASNYVPFPIRRIHVREMEENIEKIKAVVDLFRGFISQAYNFVL